MRLIIGLGNPGSEYAATRHNIGWRVIDELAIRADIEALAPNRGLRAELARATLGDTPVLLAKPQTWMNLSGEAARAIVDFYRLDPAEVVAVYDDKDLPLGTLRLRAGGGSGGHNGVRSLIAHLGTPDFVRVRLGIANEFTDRTPTDAFVLSAFSSAERAALPEIASRAADAVAAILADGLELAGTRFNS